MGIKMKTKTYILIFFILFSGVVFSQDGGYRSQAISSNFSTVEIEAYQESADKKIEDFYSYLNLLSDKEISQKVKNEIKENIFLIYTDRRLAVVDLLSNKSGKISLSEFLDKTEKQKTNYKLILEKSSNPGLFEDYWLSEYSVEVQLNGEKSVKKIAQKIYFSPVYKQFGDTTKQVWEIKLGEME